MSLSDPQSSNGEVEVRRGPQASLALQAAPIISKAGPSTLQHQPVLPWPSEQLNVTAEQLANTVYHERFRAYMGPDNFLIRFRRGDLIWLLPDLDELSDEAKLGVEKPEDLAKQYHWAAEILDCCSLELGDVNVGFLKVRYLYSETQLQTAFPALAKAYKRQLAGCELRISEYIASDHYDFVSLERFAGYPIRIQSVLEIKGLAVPDDQILLPQAQRPVPKKKSKIWIEGLARRSREVKLVQRMQEESMRKWEAERVEKERKKAEDAAGKEEAKRKRTVEQEHNRLEKQRRKADAAKREEEMQEAKRKRKQVAEEEHERRETKKRRKAEAANERERKRQEAMKPFEGMSNGQRKRARRRMRLAETKTAAGSAVPQEVADPNLEDGEIAE